MSEYRPRWMNEELVILQEAARSFFEAEFVPHEARWAKRLHHGLPDRAHVRECASGANLRWIK
jgi:hypothetical protein